MLPDEWSPLPGTLIGVRLVLVAAGILCVPACSLLVDADAVSRLRGAAGAVALGAGGVSATGGWPGTSGAFSCQIDEKICIIDGEPGCFPVDDPALGCTGEGCAPCDLPHAVAVCGFVGPCRIDRCADSFRDCDAQPENGCEVDIRTSADHCGRCDQPCSGTCTNGTCDGSAGGAGP